MNLGDVELSYNTPIRRDLGEGVVCEFLAAPLDANSFELSAVLEKSGKKVASTRVIPATPGSPLDLAFGNFRVGIVPKIK